MKKILLFLAVLPFAFLSTSQAPITQSEADEIVLERISQEMQPYTIYAKENIQEEGITLTASTGEVIELDYSSWVYYIHYTDVAQGRYLIVNARNGNLLEINAMNDEGREDLEEWIVVTAGTSLKDTKWKLAGIVDVQTGVLAELEPTDCDECFTLTFDTDSTFSGRTVNNIMWGRYEIDYNAYTFHVTDFVVSEARDRGDGELYSKILGHQFLRKIQSFTIKDTHPRILHLYYNDSKHYLKYKKIGGENEYVSPFNQKYLPLQLI